MMSAREYVAHFSSTESSRLPPFGRPPFDDAPLAARFAIRVTMR
jgi:hypothetical protein